MTVRRPKLTLSQIFVLTFAGVGCLVVALFYGLVAASQRSLVERSESLREAAGARIEARIQRDLGEASEVLAAVEQGVRTEAIDTKVRASSEAPLFELLLEHPNVSDISLTHPDHWQVSAFRTTADARSATVIRTVWAEHDGFVAELRTRSHRATLHDGVVRREGAVDPTAHLTYATTVSAGIYGTAIWSDLHPSELDRDLPEAERRVVVTVQKAIDDAAGKPAGVVRVGLLATTVDDIAKMRVEEGSADDPHRVFLCDSGGRLLTRLSPDDRRVLVDDDLRIQPTQLAPEIARALTSPKLRAVSAVHPIESDRFTVGGQRFLLTLRALEGTTGWIVAIVVPEDHYTQDLRALRDRFVGLFAVAALAALLGGAFLLARVRGGLSRLLATTSHMRDFDLAPDPRPASVRDIDEVVQSLERAKTAMRAMGKYVPIELVRELYATNREPTLGGELTRLTLMFTDIRGFTDMSERVTPNELARALGHYLEAMTTAIRTTGGTIDKFIGDAVMTLWNAPKPLPDHAKRACRAALACEKATAQLYASSDWAGLPPLVTRFGIHTADVLVGHFGAPSRFSYTALGDGVNLASRLESLCKQYGVIRIASDAVEKEARDDFAFRKLDRVAVKGKSQAVMVYELLGPSDCVRADAIRPYEEALEHYFARRFEEAAALLAPFAELDPPSRVMLDRCRSCLAVPPAADWDGAWIARSK